MRNIALRLSFDGTDYNGWQTQAKDITVQQTVEQAVAKICKHPAHVIGCGRTDAGVHAIRYCANFHTDCSIPTTRIPLALNSRLPGNIAVSAAIEAPSDFNAIGSCNRKEYIYTIHNSTLRNPFMSRWTCFYPQPLDTVRMARAAEAFVGTHDFAAVRSVGTETKTTVRTIHWCKVDRHGEFITIAVCANGFLYNMVRAIVGTLVYASYGKLEPDSIPLLLEKGDRRLTGPTMPPQGLAMHRLWYDGEVGEMMAAEDTVFDRILPFPLQEQNSQKTVQDFWNEPSQKQ